jgi:hypothetical protein
VAVVCISTFLNQSLLSDWPLLTKSLLVFVVVVLALYKVAGGKRNYRATLLALGFMNSGVLYWARRGIRNFPHSKACVYLLLPLFFFSQEFRIPLRKSFTLSHSLSVLSLSLSLSSSPNLIQLE